MLSLAAIAFDYSSPSIEGDKHSLKIYQTSEHDEDKRYLRIYQTLEHAVTKLQDIFLLCIIYMQIMHNVDDNEDIVLYIMHIEKLITGTHSMPTLNQASLIVNIVSHIV